jgi:hypothetical protein
LREAVRQLRELVAAVSRFRARIQRHRRRQRLALPVWSGLGT